MLAACGSSGEDIGGRGPLTDAGGDAATDAGDAEADAGDAEAEDAAPDVPTGPYCGDGTVDPGEDCDDGNTNRFDGCLPDCTVPPEVTGTKFIWKYHKVPGTLCLDGSTAGFGASLNPDSTKLMIYLEGGGACFNDACDFTAFSIPFVPPTDGVFNRLNPGNPVADWNMVYVPYCSGDIHGGDKDTVLADKLRHFRGYSNITKYLERWVPSFSKVKTVLITGISAGGFGSGLNAEQVAQAFGPSREFILLDDSGPPLSNKVIPPCLQRQFREVWGLDNTFLATCGADCPDKDDFASGFIDHLAKRYPNTRAAIFSNIRDAVISGYMGAGWANGTYNDCSGGLSMVPGEVYQQDLLDLREKYRNRASTYYVPGIGHTALRSPLFWTTIVNGTSLPKWFGRVLDGQVTHVGP